MKQPAATTKRVRTWAMILAAAVIGLPALVYAQSLGEKQARKRNDEILQGYLKGMNEACQTAIKTSWDWPSFKGKLVHQGGHVGSNCGTALNQMQRMCNGGDEAKEAIKAGIKTFLCRGGGGKVGKVELDKKTRTLIRTTSLDEEKQLYIEDYLKENL